jgi:hypothetical protein
MDVFLVPVGADRYELYCEVADEPQEADPGEDEFSPHWRERFSPRRLLRNLRRRFSQMLAEAERERRHGRQESADAPGWLGRFKNRMMRWVAESIAEQRLLWTLRNKAEAAFHYPADMPEGEAVDRLRKQLAKDFDKHQFWLVIDSLLFVASGLLMLVPGPNLVAYYFAFRMVGHYFSLRGARQGLGAVAWANVASTPLTELRAAVHLDPPAREARVNAVASALGLEHLARFFSRSASTA